MFHSLPPSLFFCKSLVVLSVIQSNVAQLGTGFKQVENEIPLSKTDAGDRFVPTMTEFVEKRKPALEELATSLKAMEEVYISHLYL